MQKWFAKHRELQAQRADEGFDGFTLIELLIVIVVLGILAATVIFALGGITSNSAQAACNTDAKSVETAVAAFKASPDNTSNAWPATVADLTSTGANSLTGASGKDSFLQITPNNSHYKITLGATGEVLVGGVQYDKAGAANPCTSVT